jgi:hypothetical protein
LASDVLRLGAALAPLLQIDDESTLSAWSNPDGGFFGFDMKIVRPEPILPRGQT